MLFELVTGYAIHRLCIHTRKEELSFKAICLISCLLTPCSSFMRSTAVWYNTTPPQPTLIQPCFALMRFPGTSSTALFFTVIMLMNISLRGGSSFSWFSRRALIFRALIITKIDVSTHWKVFPFLWTIFYHCNLFVIFFYWAFQFQPTIFYSKFHCILLSFPFEPPFSFEPPTLIFRYVF